MPIWSTARPATKSGSKTLGPRALGTPVGRGHDGELTGLADALQVPHLADGAVLHGGHGVADGALHRLVMFRERAVHEGHRKEAGHALGAHDEGQLLARRPRPVGGGAPPLLRVGGPPGPGAAWG